MLDNRKTIWDDLCQLKDVGTGTTGNIGSAGLVDSALKIFDSGGGRTSGRFVVNLGTAYLGNNTVSQAKYVFTLQGSASATFATPIANLARLELSMARASGGIVLAASGVGLVPSSTGNIATAPVIQNVPFDNDFQGTVYRYMRVWAHTEGTVVTAFHYSAWLSI